MKLNVIAAALVLVTFSAGCNSHSTVTGPTALTITSVSPNTGSTFGGTVVQVFGTGFQSGASVRFGTQSAIVSSLANTGTGSRLTVTTPPSAEGPVDVVVTNPGGDEARLAGEFTVSALTIYGVSPTKGAPNDGVSISGLGFRTGASVEFGGVPATVQSLTDKTIILTVPMCKPGVVDVAVMDVSGSSTTLARGFTCLGVELTVSASAVAPGGALTVSWIDSRDLGDYYVDHIVLVKVGAPDDAFGWAGDVSENHGTFDLAAPAASGDYEFRYFAWGRYLIAKSGVVVVK